MCGRFALNENPRKLAEHFDLSGDLDLSPSWNITPSTRICTITAEMKHDPLQWLVTRVMPCGKFVLQLALMPRKVRGNLVCENTRAWTLLCSPLMFNVRHRTWFDKLTPKGCKNLCEATNGIY